MTGKTRITVNPIFWENGAIKNVQFKNSPIDRWIGEKSRVSFWKERFFFVLLNGEEMKGEKGSVDREVG